MFINKEDGLGQDFIDVTVKEFCDNWDVLPKTVFTMNRKRELVIMRSIIYGFLYMKPHRYSTIEIAMMFKKDRTTILHNIQEFKKALSIENTDFNDYFFVVRHLFPDEYSLILKATDSGYFK